jgi:tRNA uridine 5-carboxymethylaminomethyl modification enzyme
MGKGFDLGLISRDHYKDLQEKVSRIEAGIKNMSSRKIYPVSEVNRKLTEMDTTPIKNPVSLYQLLKRPGITYDDLEQFEGWESIQDEMVKRQIEIRAKYEGYIKRQDESVKRFKSLEGKTIPYEIDYNVIPGLSNELKKKLSTITPASIGQAQRIPGMTQAALTALLITIKKMEMAAREVSGHEEHIS